MTRALWSSNTMEGSMALSKSHVRDRIAGVVEVIVGVPARRSGVELTWTSRPTMTARPEDSGIRAVK
jgi:hypothetical protein